MENTYGRSCRVRFIHPVPDELAARVSPVCEIPVQIDDVLYDQAQAQAHAERRTIAGQIEFWALVGRTALDNPDLPIEFVRDLLIARGEGSTLATPFVPAGKRK